MTRQTRIKFAAVVTAVVATLGVAAIAPATADNAGKSHVTNMRDAQPLLLNRVPLLLNRVPPDLTQLSGHTDVIESP